MKKDQTFEPMKAYNKTEDLSCIKYPKLVSFKLDGIRCEMKDGQLLSRSLKLIVNKQIREKLEPLVTYAQKNNIILDGEIYAHGVHFGLISSCVMTQDYTKKKAKEAWIELCEKHNCDMSREEVFSKLKFHSFDCVNQGKWGEPFIQRLDALRDIRLIPEFDDIFVEVEQEMLYSYDAVKQHFEYALTMGYEGLMLKASFSPYKCGRTTYKEDTMHKLKPYVTLDARIIRVEQATIVDSNAEKKINELGRSVTSKKKGDRILVNRASDFVVLYEGKEVKPTISLTNKEKEEIWANRESYIGKMIEYKGMLYGSLTVPRHPTFSGRYREDKD